MKHLRTLSYILWALSVVVLVIGGISRVTMIPIYGITARAFLGLSAVLQLYAMTLLLLEIVQKERG
ncbi:MAG: hypothetical protein HY347_05510 [candidate division NC10 bacterium]|nr:hypothetical protein [candidate division NC10 bacterium]